jgi:DNA-binding NarL/FixJ family response regulator
MIDWRERPERWADRRAQHLKRVTPLDETDAEIVAFGELGYSSAGIAKRVELGEGTVRSHLREIACEHGERAVYARRADELALKDGLGGDSDD